MSNREGDTMGEQGTIYFFVYGSSATIPFSKDDLVALLKKSRENNSKVGVTGMLLFKGGNFLQVLEGEELAVKEVMARIAADERHRGIFKILEGQRAERQFADWSMGFRDLNSAEIREVAGYSEFMNESLASKSMAENPERTTRLLELFRANIR